MDEMFSPVRDPLFRAQRLLRLAPREGLGAVRRAILYGLFAWVPIAAWAAASGRLSGGDAQEPLFAHFGINLRCLLGIPLLVLSETVAEVVLARIVPRFAASGVVSDREGLAAAIRSTERLRDARLPWVAIFVLTAMATLAGGVRAQQLDLMSWAVMGDGLGFGGHWFIFVARPLFLLFLLAWLWRIALVTILFRRIAALDLRLVPSHADRVGGLGFLEQAPLAFALVQLAISSMVAAHTAHEILYHGAHVASLKALMCVSIALVAILALVPLSAFAGPLRRARARARLDYGALAGRHARGLHARWVAGGAAEDEAILQAPEIGSAADMDALYAAAAGMRPVPIGRNALVAVLLPAILPMLLAVTADIPLKEILLKLAGALG